MTHISEENRAVIERFGQDILVVDGQGYLRNVMHIDTLNAIVDAARLEERSKATGRGEVVTLA